MTAGTKTIMDSTRLTQWGTWDGRIAAGGTRHSRSTACTARRTVRGACARSATPTPAAPEARCRRSSSSGRRSTGTTAARTSCASSAATATGSSAARPCCDVVGAGDPTWGADATGRGIEHLAGAVARRAVGAGAAALAGRDAALAAPRRRARRRIELEPLLTFRMRGLGYTHPEWGHGHWHGELAVGSEEHTVEELDNVEPWNIHIQQVMRARWGDTRRARRARTARVRRAPPERPHRPPRRLRAR